MSWIFASAFDYGSIFLKSKADMAEDKKENFRMEKVKKGLGFRKRFNMPCWNLPAIDVSHMRSWNSEIVY